MRTIKGLIDKYGDKLVIDYVDVHSPADNHRLYFVNYDGKTIIRWARITLKTVDDILMKMGIEVIPKNNSSSKNFKPKYGEAYSYVNAQGKVSEYVWYDDETDCALYENTELYRTEEEAEFARDKNQFLLKMQRDFEDNSDVIDWEDDHQTKYKLCYDGKDKKVFAGYSYTVDGGALHTTNGEWLEQYIKDNEENILKHYFEVKEKAE